MRPTISIIVELPQMQKLVDRACIGLKLADQFLVMTALLERRKSNLLIELHRLGHRANPERIGSQFVEGHHALPFVDDFEPSIALRIIPHRWRNLASSRRFLRVGIARVWTWA